MVDNTKIRTLEGGRAEFGYRSVLSVKNKHPKISGDYKSYIKKLPILIQNNGLGNALAFVVSKSKGNEDDKSVNAYGLIYMHLSEWLKNGDTGCCMLGKNEELLEYVISQDSSKYRQITTEILALLNWMRRFADGLIEGGEESE